MNRRIKYFRLGVDRLLQLLLDTCEGLPADAKAAGVSYDHRYRTLAVEVESATFPELPTALEGHPLELLKVEIRPQPAGQPNSVTGAPKYNFPADGHGWVLPRAGGARARCGGPGLCAVCQAEQEWVAQQLSATTAGDNPLLQQLQALHMLPGPALQAREVPRERDRQ